MIELTTGLLMLATAFSTQGTTVSAPVTAAATTTLSTSTTPIMVSTENYVRGYFKDVPILADIAGCESSFKQFDSNGNVVRGKVNKGDIGIMQINKYYHEDDAAKIGLDIYTIDGNLAYAKHLYDKYGLDPWSSSSKCWKQQDKESATTASNSNGVEIAQEIARS